MVYRFTKRLLDIVISSIAIAVLLPLFVIISLLIFVDNPGPIFYCPQRLGKNCKPFKLFKFRSMVMNAPDIRNTDGSTFNSGRDPRVTRFGYFIRRTSLDEIPQFLNVLLGSMSLVGPRPDPVDATTHYRKEDFERLSVKQGITGWAQVNGRNGISWEHRRDLDIEYVHRRSLRLDISIVLKTVFVILKKTNINQSDI